MSALIHHPNAVMTHDKYHEWHAWYILPKGFNSFLDVPAGGQFGVVHTPAPYTTSKDFGKWTYTVFEVEYHKGASWHKEPQRYYRQLKSRELIDEERAYYEGITPAPIERPVKEREETTC